MKTDVTVTTALSTGKPHSMYVLRHEFWVLGVRAGGILFGFFLFFFVTYYPRLGPGLSGTSHIATDIECGVAEAMLTRASGIGHRPK